MCFPAVTGQFSRRDPLFLVFPLFQSRFSSWRMSGNPCFAEVISVLWNLSCTGRCSAAPRAVVKCWSLVLPNVTTPETTFSFSVDLVSLPAGRPECGNEHNETFQIFQTPATVIIRRRPMRGWILLPSLIAISLMPFPLFPRRRPHPGYCIIIL